VGTDTVKGVFFTTPNRWDRFQATLPSAMTHRRRHVPVKVFASVADQVVSLTVCLGPISRMFTRSLYALIASAPTCNSHLVRTPEVDAELAFVSSLKRLTHVQTIWPESLRRIPISLRLFVDASDSGWGGFIDGVESSSARGYFTPESASFPQLGARFAGCWSSYVRTYHPFEESASWFSRTTRTSPAISRPAAAQAARLTGYTSSC